MDIIKTLRMQSMEDFESFVPEGYKIVKIKSPQDEKRILYIMVFPGDSITTVPVTFLSRYEIDNIADEKDDKISCSSPIAISQLHMFKLMQKYKALYIFFNTKLPSLWNNDFIDSYDYIADRFSQFIENSCFLLNISGSGEYKINSEGDSDTDLYHTYFKSFNMDTSLKSSIIKEVCGAFYIPGFIVSAGWERKKCFFNITKKSFDDNISKISKAIDSLVGIKIESPEKEIIPFNDGTLVCGSCGMSISINEHPSIFNDIVICERCDTV